MSFEPRTRLQKILMGIAATPRTALEHAVKYAVDHAGGGGGGGSDIVRVPFTLTVSQEGITGSTDAVFADVLTARANGKVIVADSTLDFGNGIVQFLDGVMSGGYAGDTDTLESTVLMLSGSEYEAYTIRWNTSGITTTQKKIAVS